MYAVSFIWNLLLAEQQLPGAWGYGCRSSASGQLFSTWGWMENRNSTWPWKRLFIFHPLYFSTSGLSHVRILFSVSLSLSLEFPLCIYCYTLAKSEGGRTQGDSITQGTWSRELGGICDSNSCTDSSLYISLWAYLLPTGACISIWRKKAEVETNNCLCRNPLACLPSKLLPPRQSPGNENRGETLHLK